MGINATLLGQMITFIVFILFTMKFVWPPIRQAMETRREKIAEGLAASDRAELELDKAREQAKQLIDEARNDAQTIRDRAARQANKIEDEAHATATAERKRQVEQAKAEIAQERAQMREELRGQVASLAIAAAEQLLEREVDADAHRDLLDKVAARL